MIIPLPHFMKEKQNIQQEPEYIQVLIDICKEYVEFDEELSASTKIKRDQKKQIFWIQIARNVSCQIVDACGWEEDFDLIDDISFDNLLLNYVKDDDNRFELNDMILNAVEEYIRI